MTLHHNYIYIHDFFFVFYRGVADKQPTPQPQRKGGRVVHLLPHQNKSSPLSHVLWNEIKLHLINETQKKLRQLNLKGN